MLIDGCHTTGRPRALPPAAARQRCPPFCRRINLAASGDGKCRIRRPVEIQESRSSHVTDCGAPHVFPAICMVPLLGVSTRRFFFMLGASQLGNLRRIYTSQWPILSHSPFTFDLLTTHLVLVVLHVAPDAQQLSPTLRVPTSFTISSMPGLVSDATRIWELNVYWPLGSQCGVWDSKTKGVDVWECIRPRVYYPLPRRRHAPLTLYSL